ncbi:HEAT repeat domain-containing protein [Streptomyces naphthomycinicus]|uniref:HEAT repeat domain-containing protein n=1 Tax=Streptomyces naphthomycinicus TaxID=2872625 RepID=UPI001CED30BB|nr:HEAT repeat domain-containing protein [Streptomyces sp. TML10]
MREGEAAALRLAKGAELRDVLDTGDPAAWLELDEGARAEDWGRPEAGTWERTDDGRSLLAALAVGDPLGDARLALALCHRDGRIRHRALDRIAGRPELLPLVAVRCADWAEPVRTRARERLAEALDAETAARLVPLIRRLGDRHRGDFALGLIQDVLRGAPRERLAPLFASGDRAVRRFGYRLAVEEGFLPAVELARAAARDDDTVVQTLCADAALTAVTREDATEVLDALLGARSPQARSAGVTALRRLGRPESATAFLADRSALVRACARYVLRQHGTDPLPWYRTRCADPADPALPPGAAIGLAECGQRTDAALLRPLLDHPAPGVRARAVAALRALDVTDVPRMRRLLEDPAPGVVREATLALLPSARALPAPWLLRRLEPARPRWERASSWRLLNAHEGVARLRAAVTLLGDADERLRGQAAAAVRGALLWGVRDGSGPEVAGLLGRGRDLLGGRAAPRW